MSQLVTVEEADLAAPKTDLVVTISATPDPVTVGSSLIYTVTVLNRGPVNATGVTLTNILPAGTTFDSASASQGNCSTLRALNCNLATLADGASATVTIEVVVDLSATGTLTNTAVVGSNQRDVNPGNNRAIQRTTVQPIADLSIAITDSPDPVIAGEALTYSLTVTNSGPSAVDGIILTGTLPAGVTLKAASTAQGTCSGSTSVTCELETVRQGATVTVTIEVNVESSTTGTITSSVNVSSIALDDNPANDADTEATTVQTDADLSVSASEIPDMVTPGEELTFSPNPPKEGVGLAS